MSFGQMSEVLFMLILPLLFARYGVKYILQPGGSTADADIIEACNEYNIGMCCSGVRVFTH